MATKHFCDDCGERIALIQNKVETWLYQPNLRTILMCYTCFQKHWKPIEKKFILPDIHAKTN